MEKLVITGAGGFLGSHLVEQAKLRFDTYGFSNNSKVDLEADHAFYFDLTDKESLLEYLNQIQPKYIIHSAAISSEGGCRKDPVLAEQINVEATKQIADWSAANNARLIFTSTDLVFDGDASPYSENAVCEPSMEYGKLKLAAEEAVLQHQNALVARLPLLFGIGLGDRKGSLMNFIEQVKNRQTQSLFSDEFRTPAYAKDVAAFIIELLQKDFDGLIHLGGQASLSRIELGKAFCQHLDLDTQFLNSIKRIDIGLDYRPANTSLNSELAYSLGYRPRTIEQALKEVSKLLKHETNN